MGKVVILPIREPWASMILDGKKPYEFRYWTPNWEIGQEVWIVATGKAQIPRQVVGKFFYGGTIQSYQVIPFVPRITFQALQDMGWSDGANAISMEMVWKFEKPFTLESIGIKRTPMKYQWYEVKE